MEDCVKIRPKSVDSISIIYFLSGIILLLLTIFKNTLVINYISITFLSSQITTVLIFIFSGVIILGAVGLEKGQKWGWWIIAVTACSTILVTIGTLLIDLKYTTGSLGSGYTKKIIRKLIFNLGIIIFLFKEPAYAYCDISKFNKKSNYVGVLISSIVVFLIQCIPTYITVDNYDKQAKLMQEVVTSIYLNNSDKSLSKAEEYVNKYPKDANGWLIYGNALYGAGLFDKSEKALLKASSLDPNNIACLMNLGRLYYYDFQYDKSRDYYKKILKLDYKNSEAYSSLFEIEIDKENFEKALEYAKKAYDYDMTNSTYTANLAIVYDKLNNIKKRDRFAKYAEDQGYEYIEYLKESFEHK